MQGRSLPDGLRRGRRLSLILPRPFGGPFSSLDASPQAPFGTASDPREPFDNAISALP